MIHGSPTTVTYASATSTCSTDGYGAADSGSASDSGAHTYTVRAALPHLRRSESPRIINIASTEGKGATGGNSPYAAAKLYAYWMTVNYREAYGLHASNGILFNHEGPTRGETFVTRKITRAVAALQMGLQDCLYLGNLDALRDWGHARDYAEGMWRILQHDRAEDFVLATGRTHSVRDFCEAAFAETGTRLEWRGAGLDETGHDAATGRCLIRIDPTYFRPAEVDVLQGDAAKARALLGWTSRISFAQLVAEMVAEDRRLLETERLARRAYGVME